MNLRKLKSDQNKPEKPVEKLTPEQKLRETIYGKTYARDQRDTLRNYSQRDVEFTRNMLGEFVIDRDFEAIYSFEREVEAFLWDNTFVTNYKTEILSGFRLEIRYTLNNDINWQKRVISLWI